MSNKYLLPLIIAITILTTGAVALTQFWKYNNDKVAMVSSSSVFVTQSTVVSISSDSNQISSNSSSIVSNLSSLTNSIELDCKPDVDYSSSKLSFNICDFVDKNDGKILLSKKYLGQSRLGQITKDYSEVITQNMSYGVCLHRVDRFIYSTKKLNTVQDLNGCDNQDFIAEFNKLKN